MSGVQSAQFNNKKNPKSLHKLYLTPPPYHLIIFVTFKA